MAFPDVVTREEWLEARKQLLVKEKQATRAQDALNAERRLIESRAWAGVGRYDAALEIIEKDTSKEGQDLRAEIWRNIFPAETPLDQVDPLRLARLDVAGGNIRNIALHAAFLAAETGEPISMGSLLQAAHYEASKRERPLSDAETRGWA